MGKGRGDTALPICYFRSWQHAMAAKPLTSGVTLEMSPNLSAKVLPHSYHEDQIGPYLSVMGSHNMLLGIETST